MPTGPRRTAPSIWPDVIYGRHRYENSNGLAEIAVNQGRADCDLGLSIGIPVEIVF